MTRPRYQPPHSAFVVLFLACMTLFAMSLSCSKSKRTDTLRASVIGVNAARDSFTTWDRQHQQQIVEDAKTREEAEGALTTYRDRRKVVVDGFEIAYRALAVAATQTDDPSLKIALTSSGELVGAVQRLIEGQ